MAILKQTDVSGSLNVSGSITVVNSVTASAFSGNGAGITGVVSSSFATTASYALNASGQVPPTASYAISSSFATTASYATVTSFTNLINKPTLISSSAQIDAGSITGTLLDGRLSSNVPLKNAGNVFTTAQTINTGLTGNYALKLMSGSDAQPYFGQENGGRMLWGAGGSTSPDVTLYRSAANVLKTDDSFVANLNITVGNSLIVSGSTSIFGAAGARPITLNGTSGIITIQGNNAGWATGYQFTDTSGSTIGGFGALGSSDLLTYYFIGTAYTDATVYVLPTDRVGINHKSPTATLYISGSGDNIPTLITRMSGDQTVNIQEWQGPTGTVVAFVSSSGLVSASAFIGNTTSATKLATARTIAGVSFDGTANISIPYANLTSKPTSSSGYGIVDSVVAATLTSGSGYVNFVSSYDGGSDVTFGRSADRPPNHYKKALGLEFKSRSTIGMSGTGLYAGLLTMAAYSDASSGITHGQIGFVDLTVQYRRASWGGTWSEWHTFAFLDTPQTFSSAQEFSSNVTIANGSSLYGRRNTGNAQVAFFRYDAGTDDLSTVMGGSIWRVRDTGAGVPMSLTTSGVMTLAGGLTINSGGLISTGSVTIATGGGLLGPGSGSGFILARNAANTSYLDLLYLDTNDVARIPRELIVGFGITAASATINGTTSTMRVGLAGDVNPYVGFNDGTKLAYLEMVGGDMRLTHNGSERIRWMGTTSGTTLTGLTTITGNSLANVANQTVISAWSGSGIHLEGSVANFSQDAITYASGGGGGAAIAFARDNSYGTYLNFYVNDASNSVGGGVKRIGGFDTNGLTVDGNIYFNSSNKFFVARYTANSDTYAAALGWQSATGGVLQLGNNGVNEIRAGHSATGGTLRIVVNNTANFTSPSNGIIAAQFNVDGTVTTGRGILLDRVNSNNTGIKFYSAANNMWQEYMSNPGASQGIGQFITSAAGTYVTSWARRSIIEAAGGYGWIWETGAASGATTSTPVMELRYDGLLNVKGGLVISSGGQTITQDQLAFNTRPATAGSANYWAWYNNDSTQRRGYIGFGGGTGAGSTLYINSDTGPIQFQTNAGTPISSISTTTGYSTAYGMSDASNGVRVINPGGASRHSTTSSEVGAIKIKLPVSKYSSNTMHRFTVKIFNYATGTSLTFEIGGYNYASGAWVNMFATQLSDAASTPYTIRFGYDGTSNCVWIGETNSSWSYPQIFVTDFQGGYSSDDAGWSTGWAISIVTAFDSVYTSRVAANTLNTNNYPAASPSNLGNYVVQRNVNGDFDARYGNFAYVYSSDDVSAGTISHIVAKFGDNYHRSATPQKVANFLANTVIGNVYVSSPVGHTYGSIRVDGLTTGYSGIYFGSSAGTISGMFDASGNGGDYDSSTGWHYYYDRSTTCLAVGGATVASGYKLYVNGNAIATGWYTTSSRTAKKNISKFTKSALDILNSVNIVNFRYIDDEKETPKVGFIAEDTNTILSTPEQNVLDTTNAIGLLIKAVQELAAENKVLKAAINAIGGK